MPRTFYTIDDLKMFCKTNNFSKFNSAEHDNKPLIVQSVETFEVTNNASDGLMPVALKACHIGLNRNRSYITEDVMRANMASFKGRPILGSIIKTDTGEYEFHSHDVNFTEDGDIEYVEQPVGVISQIDEPYLEYDKEKDKTYLYVNGHIFTEYSKAAEILQRRKTCKCSVEIAVNEMSWNCDEDYLSIDSFTFMGVTILGYEQDGVTEIQEGMEGSKITIDSFSERNNSMFTKDYSGIIVDLLSNIDKKLDNLSYNQFDQEGVEKEMDNAHELTEVIEEMVESEQEPNVEVEETDDEIVIEEAEEEIVADEASEIVDDIVVNELDDSQQPNTYELKYELSHDDIRVGLYQLLSAAHNDEYYMLWIAEVFDDKFIYGNWYSNKYYRQSYSINDSNVEFVGEPVEVFSEWLSKEEKDALASLKADYSELKAFKESYDIEVARAEKNAVLEAAEYAELKTVDAFKELCDSIDKYSIDEIKVKADLIFAAHMKSKFDFSANVTEEKPHSVGFNFNVKPAKKAKAYGNLFDN